MILAELDQTLVISKRLRILLQIGPGKLVDAVRRIIAVVYSLLVAEHLFAGKDERNTLRSEDAGLRKLIDAEQLGSTYCFRDILVGKRCDACLQTVYQTHIVVAAYITNLLGRIIGPRLLVIVHLCHIHLRMSNATHDTKLQTLLLTCKTSQERTLMVIRERTTERIAHIIAESTDALELLGIRLHRQFLGRISTTACTPSLTINIDARIDAVYHLTDSLHGFDVMNAHQVETETVDMIFVYPVFHALQHKLAHERLLRSSLVTAAGTVRILSILGLAIVIIRIGTLEVAAVDIESMVIYGIENHSDACLMQRHHHLLELLDAGCWRIRVGSVTAFRHIIVLRIITPVELWFVESGLIYRSEIEYRLEVDGVDAQILEIFDGLRLGEGEIFTLIFQAGCRRNGEITHVKLVDNEIGWRF